MKIFSNPTGSAVKKVRISAVMHLGFAQIMTNLPAALCPHIPFSSGMSSGSANLVQPMSGACHMAPRPGFARLARSKMKSNTVSACSSSTITSISLTRVGAGSLPRLVLTSPSAATPRQDVLCFYLHRLYLPDLVTVLPHGAIRRKKAAARCVEYGHAGP